MRPNEASTQSESIKKGRFCLTLGLEELVALRCRETGDELLGHGVLIEAARDMRIVVKDQTDEAKREGDYEFDQQGLTS